MKALALQSLFIFLAIIVAYQAKATVLWMGGEDLDFQAGDPICTNTAASSYRSGYARFSVYACGPNFKISRASTAFNGGPVTSVWISGRAIHTFNDNPARSFGVGRTGKQSSLWVGNTSGNGFRTSLWKYDGTTWTNLASESNQSISVGTITKFDMEIVSYGATATVRVYVNGGFSPIITYTGDVTGGGATDLDQMVVSGQLGGAQTVFSSELLASNTDTRLMSVVTHAPNLAGTTTAWTGAFTDVNENTINDATIVTSATSAQNEQFQLTDLPSGSFSVQSVRLSSRSSSTGAGISGYSLGVFTNAAVSVPSPISLTPAWTPIETYYSINPITSSVWTPSEINSLQMNMQSAP